MKHCGIDEVVLVKLGGSVITDKEYPLSVNAPVLLQLAEQLYMYLLKRRTGIVLVHGGGSFGHPLVKECYSRDGLITHECYVRVSYYMRLLNIYVMEALISQGIKAVSIPPGSICLHDGVNGDYVKCEMGIVKSLVKNGLVPVLFGDVIPSLGNCYKVLSGDAIIFMLAELLEAHRIIFLTDVDGLYDKDPKVYRDAKLIKELRGDDVRRLVRKRPVSKHDVTGGMLGKLAEMGKHRLSDVCIYIINGKVKGNLYNALLGRNFRGTVIWY